MWLICCNHLALANRIAMSAMIEGEWTGSQSKRRKIKLGIWWLTRHSRFDRRCMVTMWNQCCHIGLTTIRYYESLTGYGGRISRLKHLGSSSMLLQLGGALLLLLCRLLLRGCHGGSHRLWMEYSSCHQFWLCHLFSLTTHEFGGLLGHEFSAIDVLLDPNFLEDWRPQRQKFGGKLLNLFLWPKHF